MQVAVRSTLQTAYTPAQRLVSNRGREYEDQVISGDIKDGSTPVISESETPQSRMRQGNGNCIYSV